VPRALKARAPHVDVAAAMDEQPHNRAVSPKVVDASAGSQPSAAESDPFAEVEV
jgi:hypothetical protein